MAEMKSLLPEISDSVLVLIDIQERLAAAMPAGVKARVLRGAGTLVRAATLLELPIVVTEQYPKGLGPVEAAVAEQLPPKTHRVEKTCFSCAGANAFMATLEQTGRHQVVLCGMETHVCVLQTAFDLQCRGYAVFVVEDAVCSRAKPNQENALARLRQAGIVVSNLESTLLEWLRDANHKHFKTFSAWIR
jgi:nicotinamidase-related amidase